MNFSLPSLVSQGFRPLVKDTGKNFFVEIECTVTIKVSRGLRLSWFVNCSNMLKTGYKIIGRSLGDVYVLRRLRLLEKNLREEMNCAIHAFTKNGNNRKPQKDEMNCQKSSNHVLGCAENVYGLVILVRLRRKCSYQLPGPTKNCRRKKWISIEGQRFC